MMTMQAQAALRGVTAIITDNSTGEHFTGRGPLTPGLSSELVVPDCGGRTAVFSSSSFSRTEVAHKVDSCRL